MTDSFSVTPEQLIKAFALPKDTAPETVEERLFFAASSNGKTIPETRELREYKEDYIILHFPFGVTALVDAEDENLTFRLKSGSSKVHAVWDARPYLMATGHSDYYHRWAAGAKSHDGMQVNHKVNTLDNRRANLELVTPVQNRKAGKPKATDSPAT